MLVQRHRVDVRAGKPGRYLSVFALDEIARYLNGIPNHVYTNAIDPGAVAGNHYHRRKREAMVCVAGEVDLYLREVADDGSLGPVEIVKLAPSANGYDLVLVLPMVAHAVVNRSRQPATVMVFATEAPRYKGDDFDALAFEP